MNDYNDFLFLISSNNALSGFNGGCDEWLIELAQVKLGRVFPLLYRRYLSEFGGSQDVYGLIDDTFEAKFRPDAVGVTLLLRQEYGLPSDFLVINEVGDGEVLCLKISAIAEADSAVFAFVPGMPIENQFFEQVDDSFAAFLLNIYKRKFP